MSFENLGLRAELVRAVLDKGYETPSPIQARAIPAILEGRDVQGGAQTGTGKTAAFVLPMLQLLDGRPSVSRCPRALVLTPTRELAAQVGASAVAYGKGLKLRTSTVFGGVGLGPQIAALRQGVDILVATPGRLLDLCGQRAVDLRSVEILVLDEADRMLDMGFIHDIKRILKLLPHERQNLLFSATYSDDVKKLVDGLLRNPEVIEVARRNTAAETVDQVAYLVQKGDKRAALARLIIGGKWEQVLVFARTKHGANRLATQLDKDGIPSAAIHGNKSQSARTRALADFKARKVQCLVATDIAARGLDIAQLPHVVNFELPNVPEDYVHRIGRTGRAGAEGSAVSLVDNEEMKLLKAIERVLKRQIPMTPLPEFKGTMPLPKPGGQEPSRGQPQQRRFEGGKRPPRGGNRNGGGGRNSRGPSEGRSSEPRRSDGPAAPKQDGGGLGGRLKSLFSRKGRAPSGRP